MRPDLFVELSNPIAEFRQKGATCVPGVLVLLIAAFAGAVTWYSTQENGRDFIYAIISAAFLWGLTVGLLVIRLRIEMTRTVVYEDGVANVRGSTVLRACLWRDIEAVYRCDRQAEMGHQIGYHLYLENGQHLWFPSRPGRLRPYIRDPDSFSDYLTTAYLAQKWPLRWAQFEADGEMDFEAVSVCRNDLHLANRTIPWNDVGNLGTHGLVYWGASMGDDALTVECKSDGEQYLVPLSEIRDFPIFVKLATTLRDQY